MAARVGLSREDVIGVAVALADEQGFDAVTISQVARKLGVRSQSIYAHVDGLAGLRREVQLRAFQLLGIRIREAVVGLSPRDAMVAWPMAVARFDSEHPGMYAARIAPPGDDALLLRMVADAEAIPQALIRSFGLSEDEALHRDRMVWAALYGYEALRRAGRFRTSVDPDVTLHKLVEALASDLERTAKTTAGAARQAAAPTPGPARRRRTAST